jgi:hypothetical protein
MGCGQFARMFLAMEKNVALDMLEVSFFGSQAEMSQARGNSHLFEKFRRRHNHSNQGETKEFSGGEAQSSRDNVTLAVLSRPRKIIRLWRYYQAPAG